MNPAKKRIANTLKASDAGSLFIIPLKDGTWGVGLLICVGVSKSAMSRFASNRLTSPPNLDDWEKLRNGPCETWVHSTLGFDVGEWVLLHRLRGFQPSEYFVAEWRIDPDSVIILGHKLLKDAKYRLQKPADRVLSEFSLAGYKWIEKVLLQRQVLSDENGPDIRGSWDETNEALGKGSESL